MSIGPKACVTSSKTSSLSHERWWCFAIGDPVHVSQNYLTYFCILSAFLSRERFQSCSSRKFAAAMPNPPSAYIHTLRTDLSQLFSNIFVFFKGTYDSIFSFSHRVIKLRYQCEKENGSWRWDWEPMTFPVMINGFLSQDQGNFGRKIHSLAGRKQNWKSSSAPWARRGSDNERWGNWARKWSKTRGESEFGKRQWSCWL